MVLQWLRRRLLRWLLRDSDVYDVVAALRGPDFPAPNLKSIFTSRLRHLLGVAVSFMDVRCERRVSLRSVLEAAREAGEWYSKSERGFKHWYEHMWCAIASLCFMEGRADTITELRELHQLLTDIARYACGDINEEKLAERARQLNICREAER